MTRRHILHAHSYSSPEQPVLLSHATRYLRHPLRVVCISVHGRYTQRLTNRLTRQAIAFPSSTHRQARKTSLLPFCMISFLRGDKKSHAESFGRYPTFSL